MRWATCDRVCVRVRVRARVCARLRVASVTQLGVVLHPLHRKHLGVSGDLFGCHNWERKALCRLGMLLNIPLSIGQPSKMKNHPTQNVNSAEVEKLGSM